MKEKPLKNGKIEDLLPSPKLVQQIKRRLVSINEKVLQEVEERERRRPSQPRRATAK
jgi:hypothetical protein